MKHKQRNLVLVKLVCVPLLWGGALTAGRVVSAEFPPLTMTCLRFFIAGIFLLTALIIREKRIQLPAVRDIPILLLVTLFGTILFNLFLFNSLKTITAVRSSVLLAFTPSFVLLLAMIFFREKLTPRTGGGLLLAITGAVITITEGNIGRILTQGLSLGDLLMIGAVLSWAAYSIVITYGLKRMGPLPLMVYTSFLGSLLLLPITFTEPGWQLLPELSAAAFGSFIFLSIGAAGIAYLWYFEGVDAVGSTKASVFMNLEPVAAIAAGMILLGERISLPVTIGALLVIGGLYLTNKKQKERPVSESKLRH